jgi:Glycosyl transferase family 2
VQLSILIPTNRRGLLVCSRIAQAASWAGPNIEVIIRDNSGDPEKRKLLKHFRRDNCNIIVAEPCDPLANVSDIINRATGDFIFLLADDDFCFEHAIAALPDLLDRHGKDPAVAGVTGAYAVETSQGSAVVTYQNAESDDVALRVAGFLAYEGPNVLHYAPVRRDIVRRVFAFMNTLPFYFSFHDQIVCLLYLLNGKFVRLPRFLYLYDLGPWETADTAQQRDVDYYRQAGLDPVINKLHWFLCGFEGANLIRNANVFPDYPLGLRQMIADRWFSSMFLRFKGQRRLAFDSRFAGEAETLCAKFQASAGQLTFQDMLTDISGFFALFSKPQAQSYYEFWDAVINRRAPPARPAAAAAAEERQRGMA